MRFRTRAILLGGLLAACHASAQTGPKPVPARVDDWPGKGIAGAYDLWTKRRAEFWANREKDQGAVVFFGDSITQGWDAPWARPPRSLQGYFPGLKVANRGIGSDTSRRLLWRLQEDVLDLHPKGIVLLIGINDLAAGVTPADVAENIRGILDAIRRNNPMTPVILCHVMPWKPVPGKSPIRVLQTNALIDALAVGRPQVKVLDTFKLFATPENTAPADLFPDLLHPNTAGYDRWAAALRPLLPR